MKIPCDLNKMRKTIVIVTHDPNVVQYASKSITLFLKNNAKVIKFECN